MSIESPEPDQLSVTPEDILTAEQVTSIKAENFGATVLQLLDEKQDVLKQVREIKDVREKAIFLLKEFLKTEKEEKGKKLIILNRSDTEGTDITDGENDEELTELVMKEIEKYKAVN